MTSKIFPVFHEIPATFERKVNTRIIGTHDGTFHCDEATAISMLSLTKEFGDEKNIIVVRTRDEKILSQCDLICDVGSVYDPSKHRYDHHQKTFSDTLNNVYKTRLSSAGLIYKHFGHEIISNIFDSAPIQDEDIKKNKSKWVAKIYDIVYQNFVEHIDAIDNGIEVSDQLPLKYRITTHLSARVGELNPSWTVKDSRSMENQQFQKAMSLTGQEFTDRVRQYITGWLPARSIVERAIDNRFNIDQSGSIIVIDTFCPWKQHLFELEEEKNIQNCILYALFQDSKGTWRIQCVPVDPNSFKNRLSLPQEWCGLRDDELSKLSGIPGCIFVHASGFIGGNSTYEGALKMAQHAIKKQHS